MLLIYFDVGIFDKNKKAPASVQRQKITSTVPLCLICIKK